MRSNAPTELVAAMVRSPERPVALHAAAALHALTVGHTAGQVALQECGGIQVFNAAYPNLWQHLSASRRAGQMFAPMSEGLALIR